MSTSSCGSLKRRISEYFAGLTTLQRYLFAFFVLLLLSLNIVNAVYGYRRYQQAQSNPMRIRTVEKVDLSDLPPFSVLFDPNFLNVSCASTDADCQIVTGPFSPFPLLASSKSGNNPCLQLRVSKDPHGPMASDLMVLTGLNPNQLAKIGYEGLQRQSFPSQLPIYTFNVNGTASGMSFLAYSGLRRLNGDTEYSVSTQEAITHSYSVGGCYAPEEPLVQFAVMFTRSLAEDPWIAMDMQVEQANYSLVDWASSIATAFNLSLTVVAFLFPLALFIDADEERVDVKGQLTFRLGAKRSTSKKSIKSNFEDQLLEERGL